MLSVVLWKSSLEDQFIKDPFSSAIMAYYSCCRTAIKGYTDGSVSAPVPVVRGEWEKLPEVVQAWVRFKIALCQPAALHIMDGSDEEDAMVIF